MFMLFQWFMILHEDNQYFTESDQLYEDLAEDNNSEGHKWKFKETGSYANCHTVSSKLAFRFQQKILIFRVCKI